MPRPKHGGPRRARSQVALDYHGPLLDADTAEPLSNRDVHVRLFFSFDNDANDLDFSLVELTAIEKLGTDNG